MLSDLIQNLFKSKKKFLDIEILGKNGIYHLKLNSHGLISFAACNAKSSLHWRKYNKANFIRGTIYDASQGEKPIEGRKCTKCFKLI